MKKVIYAAAVILAVSAPASFAANNYEHNQYSSLKSSPDAKKASYDLQFLDTITAHHRQGISMAQMVLEKSQNTEVKSRAESLIETQKSDIAKIKVLRDNIQEKAPEAVNISLNGMESVDLEDLYAESVKKFDAKFLKMIIRHKESAKEMARDASKDAKSAEVRLFAEELNISETAEIAKLKELLKRL